MARLIKIPPKLNPEILKKVGEGLSAQKIAEWLKKEHDIKTSSSSVSRLLLEWKEERKQIAQRAYADAVANHAFQDLDIISDLILKLKDRVDVCFKDNELLVGNKLADTLLKYLSKRMDLSGMNVKEAPDDERLKEELLKKIEEYKK